MDLQPLEVYTPIEMIIHFDFILFSYCQEYLNKLYIFDFLSFSFVLFRAVLLHLVCFIIGSCWFFIFIADDITKDLAAFNIDIKTSDGNHDHDMIQRFNILMQTYADAKQ